MNAAACRAPPRRPKRPRAHSPELMERAMLSPASKKKRQSMVDACRSMNALGINQGTSGNISLREGGGMLITPTSMPYDAMTPDDIIEMRLDGKVVGNGRPSTEWRFHRAILQARPEVNAIVHAHPTYCTTIAIMERGIPAIHYMVAAARRGHHPLRPLCDFRHRGTVGQRGRSAEGQEGLSSRAPRHDRARGGPRRRHVARGRGRDAGAPVCQLPSARRAAAACRRRKSGTSPPGWRTTGFIPLRNSRRSAHFGENRANSPA